MNDRVGIRELRQQASRLLKRVVAGESIEVTDHGRPIARIVPLRPRALDQLVLEGRASAPNGDLLALADRLGLPGPADGRAASEALTELRGSDDR